MALKPKGRKPAELGPPVRVVAARAAPGAEASALVGGPALKDTDQDGFRELGTDAQAMWQADATPDLKLEFELAGPVPLSAVQVWNFNAEWQTTNGIRKADVAVSADGTTWQTVVRGAEFPEAEGRPDYDEPVVLKLNGATACKVRLENLVAWGTGKVGLGAVMFHQAPGPQAAPLQPEDGARAITVTKPALKWVAGLNAKEHRVFLGTEPGQLASLGSATQPELQAPALKPESAYYWRVDEVQADGSVVAGRVARFDTIGLVAWWKLDETKGNKAEDACGLHHTAYVSGKANWAPGQGRIGGAFEFDGKQNQLYCGSVPEFDFADAITVSAWVKVRKFDKDWQAIVTKGDTAWRLQRQLASGMVTFSFDTGSSTNRSDEDLIRLISKRTIDDGQWHHLIGLSDGVRAALFIDGELEASAPAKAIARNKQPVMIGCNSEHYDRRFNGWIDDVRLYGYGLSNDEVKALYRAGCETK